MQVKRCRNANMVSWGKRARAACMRPLQCKPNNRRPVNTCHPYRFAGGMYAAPTHRPNAVAIQKRFRGANGHGKITTRQTRLPAVAGWFVGAAYMRPGRGARPRGVCGAPAVCPGLQGRVNAVVTKKREIPRGFAGGMYAAPTHGSNAVATQKRYCEANGHGGRERPPYRVVETVDFPANPTWGSRFAARFLCFKIPPRGARHHNFSFLFFNF